MEQNNENKKPSKKPKVNTAAIRVLKSTAKTLHRLLQKLNKKPHGRQVKMDDILLKALPLLTESHFEEIKASTLSNADKLEAAYLEYCKKNGQISKDEYLGQLLKNALGHDREGHSS